MWRCHLCPLAQAARASIAISMIFAQPRQKTKVVDQGGYQKREYWKQAFRKDVRALSWADAMKLFVDKTGRPGPTTWTQGEYARGQYNYPVTGVSCQLGSGYGRDPPRI